MKLRQGSVFNEAPCEEVVDFLRHRRIETHRLPADHLCVTVEGEELFLRVMNGRTREYPVRESFFLKLLKWGSLPAAGIRRLSAETVAGILNDLLLAITSGDVTIRTENGEAVTITSRHYSELSDLDVIQTALPLGITGITRTDFFLRMYGAIGTRTEVRPGDVCGFGFNILNSETGFRALSAYHYILRYICSNGAILRLGGQVGTIHYRHPQGYLQRFLEEQLQPLEKTREQVVASVRRAADAAMPPERDPVYARLRALIGRRTFQNLLSTIPERPSLFSLVNLVTAHARGLDPGQRLQMESLAGELLMGQNQTSRSPVFAHPLIRKRGAPDRTLV